MAIAFDVKTDDGEYVISIRNKSPFDIETEWRREEMAALLLAMKAAVNDVLKNGT
jgi:hypothetical protein